VRLRVPGSRLIKIVLFGPTHGNRKAPDAASEPALAGHSWGTAGVSETQRDEALPKSVVGL